MARGTCEKQNACRTSVVVACSYAERLYAGAMKAYLTVEDVQSTLDTKDHVPGREKDLQEQKVSHWHTRPTAWE